MKRPSTGTPGTWANTGSGPAAYIEGAAAKKSPVGLIAGVAAGVFILGGVGIAAMRMSSHEAPPAASAVAAAPAAGPSLDEVRAAAAEEAKKITTLAQKDADEKIRKAEDDAKAAEARATKAEADSKDQDDANKARERVKILKAAVAGGVAKPPVAVTPPPAPANNPPPSNPSPQPTSGRRIRTEL